jgi:uncharacterized membrane protein
MLAVGAGAWTRIGTTTVAAFLASLVECVEALTVVLAVGSVRGWRSALTGAVAALALLGALVAVLGRQLGRIPLHLIQTGVGAMILLFGLRWLRKAILRAAGRIPMHDESAVFRENTAAMQHAWHGKMGALDRTAFAATFHITMLEGTEVVFIVVALGAGGLLLPAITGAMGALITVSALGLGLHRPLSRVPENTLKFVVGVLLSGFGTFWIGEGAGFWWPGGDVVIPALMAGYLGVACALVAACRDRSVPVEG